MRLISLFLLATTLAFAQQTLIAHVKQLGDPALFSDDSGATIAIPACWPTPLRNLAVGDQVSMTYEMGHYEGKPVRECAWIQTCANRTTGVQCVPCEHLTPGAYCMKPQWP